MSCHGHPDCCLCGLLLASAAIAEADSGMGQCAGIAVSFGLHQLIICLCLFLLPSCPAEEEVPEPDRIRFVAK